MSQQYDLASAVGYQYDDQAVSRLMKYEDGHQLIRTLFCQVSWNQRDLLLYGAGIGAKANDFAIINGTLNLLRGGTVPKKNVPTLPSITYPADFRFLSSHRALTSVWLFPRTWYVHASGVCIALSSTLG